ncbi:MAG: tRNA (N6-threonylcarbamoyladenosine(37)-N6)-methyltransferase TrmO [Bdellovibrionales bacterium]
MFELKTLGIVESCYLDKFGTPRQPGLVSSSKAFLRINPEFQPQDSLQGLEQFSHVWVIFYFHKNSASTRFHAKVHPPRLEGEKRGVLATRSPHRPNPIGLSLVEIISVEKDGVWVKGIDLIEGTPILDLKPYLPYVESQPEARGAWAQTSPSKPFEVKILCGHKMQEWERQRPGIEKLVTETLSFDPRPDIYKGYEGQSSPHREKHALRIYEGDVHFTYPSPHLVEIYDIHFKNDEF